MTKSRLPRRSQALCSFSTDVLAKAGLYFFFMKKDTFNKKAIITSIIVVIFAAVALNFYLTPKGSESDSRQFERDTGLDWPEGAIIINKGYDYFLSDGDEWLVLQTDEDTIKTMLEQQPRLSGEWSPGPIPEKIASRVSFGSTLQDPGGRDLQKEKQILASPHTYYSVEGRYEAFGNPWWDGTILILHPPTNTIWYSRWDF